MPLAVVSEFSSPPISPGRATDNGGFPPSYYSQRTWPIEGQQCVQSEQSGLGYTKPSREELLAHIKTILQPTYDRGAISKLEFVTIVKGSLTEVLSGGTCHVGWEKRCVQVVKSHLHRVAPGSQIHTTTRKRADTSSAMSTASSMATTTTTATTTAKKYRGLSEAETQQQISRRIRDSKKAGLSEIVNGTSTSPRPRSRSNPSCTQLTNRVLPLPPSSVPAGNSSGFQVLHDSEISKDALSQMTQGLSRLRKLTKKLKHTSPLEAEIFLHELDNYHFHATVVAAAGPVADESDGLVGFLVEHEATSREHLQSDESDSRKQIEKLFSVCAAQVQKTMWERGPSPELAAYRCLEQNSRIDQILSKIEMTEVMEETKSSPLKSKSIESNRSRSRQRHLKTPNRVASHSRDTSVASTSSSFTPPPKEEVVEYIRTLLQPLYNSGVMDQNMFLSIIKNVSSTFYSTSFNKKDSWRHFIRKTIEKMITEDEE